MRHDPQVTALASSYRQLVLFRRQAGGPHYTVVT